MRKNIVERLAELTDEEKISLLKRHMEELEIVFSDKKTDGFVPLKIEDLIKDTNFDEYMLSFKACDDSMQISMYKDKTELKQINIQYIINSDQYDNFILDKMSENMLLAA